MYTLEELQGLDSGYERVAEEEQGYEKIASLEELSYVDYDQLTPEQTIKVAFDLGVNYAVMEKEAAFGVQEIKAGINKLKGAKNVSKFKGNVNLADPVNGFGGQLRNARNMKNRGPALANTIQPDLVDPRQASKELWKRVVRQKPRPLSEIYTKSLGRRIAEISAVAGLTGGGLYAGSKLLPKKESFMDRATNVFK